MNRMSSVRGAKAYCLQGKLAAIAILLALCLTNVVEGAGQAQAILAPAPPMGWNSWDAYGLTITEPQFRDNAEVLAKVLKPHGWNYAVIDEGWFLKNPLDRPNPEKLAYELDANGRYIPVPSRFPSALQGEKNTGFTALGAYVHSLGLKFGIHIVRGIPRESVTRNLPVSGSSYRAQEVADQTDPCPWDPTNWGVKDTPAGQAWYDSLLQQYAGWGVDYLKVDCISDHPYKPTEIRMIHNAIAKTGRPIVLSLSPGPTSPGLVKELTPYAQMWRISDDVWDIYRNPKAWPRSLYDHFELVAAWASYAQPGRWPDADMLPFGYLGPYPGDGVARTSRLTLDEEKMMLTLWSIARSPLILGANLTRLDEPTKKLLTNPAVLALDRFGHDARQVAREGTVVVWTASGEQGKRYLAAFNLGEDDASVDRLYGFYNLPAKSFRAHELWSGDDLGSGDRLKVTLRPHTCILLELQP